MYCCYSFFFSKFFFVLRNCLFSEYTWHLDNALRWWWYRRPYLFCRNVNFFSTFCPDSIAWKCQNKRVWETMNNVLEIIETFLYVLNVSPNFSSFSSFLDVFCGVCIHKQPTIVVQTNTWLRCVIILINIFYHFLI